MTSQPQNIWDVLDDKDDINNNSNTDTVPLVKNRGSNNNVGNGTSASSSANRVNKKSVGGFSSTFKGTIIMGLFFLCMLGVAIFYSEDILLSFNYSGFGSGDYSRGSGSGGKQCAETCTFYGSEFVRKWGKNNNDNENNNNKKTSPMNELIPNLDTMLRRAKIGKNMAKQKLQRLYGEEYYTKIFETDNTLDRDREISKNKDGDDVTYDDFPKGSKYEQKEERKDVSITGFQGSNEKKGVESISRIRFMRKVQMKLLDVITNMVRDMENINGCDCAGMPISIDNINKSDDVNEQKRKKNFLLRNLKEEDDNENRNDNNDSNETATEDEEELTKYPKLKEYYNKFIWVNGGHSSAAGHGNLFNETYTSIVEQISSDVYGAVGIKLIGRNHAMGGMSSSPELALCNEAVYGKDADLLTWNFGMTDGADLWHSEFYATKRALHSNRPLLLDVVMGANNIYDGGYRRRISILRELEKHGIPTMQMIVDAFYSGSSLIQDVIPNSEGLTQEQIDAIPTNLRNFRCGDKLEDGEPFCKEQKYSPADAIGCEVPHKAPWHPGWKANALGGYILGMFMIDLLIDSIEDLKYQYKHQLKKMEKEKEEESKDDRKRNLKTNSNNDDTMDDDWNVLQVIYDRIYTKLKQLEDKNYKKFTKEYKLQEDHPRGSDKDKNKKAHEKLNQDHLYKSKALCRTGLLPSMSRYLNIGSIGSSDTSSSSEISDKINSNRIIHETYTDKQTTISSKAPKDYYYSGLVVENIKSQDKDSTDYQTYTNNNEIPLVYEEKKHNADSDICDPLEVAIDFKDYYYVQYNEGDEKDDDNNKGGKIITLPNDAERIEYLAEGGGEHEFHGLIVMCFNKCDWGKCPKGALGGSFQGVNDPRDDVFVDVTKKIKKLKKKDEHGNDIFYDDKDKEPSEFTIWVNNKKVTEMINLNDVCLALGSNENDDAGKDDATYYFKPKIKESGKKEYYEIRIQVHKPDTFLRVSSFVLI